MIDIDVAGGRDYFRIDTLQAPNPGSPKGTSVDSGLARQFRPGVAGGQGAIVASEHSIPGR